MAKYYKGKFTSYVGETDNNLFEITEDGGKTTIIRRSFDDKVLFRPMKAVYEVSSRDVPHFIKNKELVEIEDGEILCNQFDTLYDAFEDMVLSYIPKFQDLLK